jgi:hypothetical protein
MAESIPGLLKRLQIRTLKYIRTNSSTVGGVLKGSLRTVPEIIDTVFAKTSPKQSFCMTENEFWACFRENWVYKFGHCTQTFYIYVKRFKPNIQKRRKV